MATYVLLDRICGSIRTVSSRKASNVEKFDPQSINVSFVEVVTPKKMEQHGNIHTFWHRILWKNSAATKWNGSWLHKILKRSSWGISSTFKRRVTSTELALSWDFRPSDEKVEENRDSHSSRNWITLMQRLLQVTWKWCPGKLMRW